MCIIKGNGARIKHYHYTATYSATLQFSLLRSAFSCVYLFAWCRLVVPAFVCEFCLSLSTSCLLRWIFVTERTSNAIYLLNPILFG